jgi:branched-chain amino acid transport system ATP-binding protein
MTSALLSVENLHTHLGDSHIIQGVSFDVAPGEVVALLGRNGAGKTTTLRSIMRMAPPRSGEVRLAGRSLAGMRTYDVANAGIGFVQETRAIFPSLSVEENLEIAVRAGRGGNAWTPDRVFVEFPSLAERRQNGGAQLSGGEQKMLAIARALVGNPRLLLLDEPSEGLAPLIVRRIAEILHRLRKEGMTMLLVEQNFALATELADRVVILGKGRVRWSGTTDELRGCDEVRHAWLGI